MATIRDVAQLAGVSTASVSHVLNETRAVSAELRERVMAAMEQLQYHPNAVARSLRLNETLTIGLILPNIEIPFYARYAHYIEAAASDIDYNVVLCNSNGSLTQELRYLDHLTARRVDGFICVNLLMTAEHAAPILRNNAPVIWLEEARRGHHFDSVLINNFQGAYNATTHLIHLGHRTIACITGPATAQSSLERVSGYEQALADYQIDAEEHWQQRGDYSASSGYIAASKLLELPQPPTAIFACNDMMAIGALQAIAAHGLRVPETIAVIGFDGIALTEHSYPPLSTIEQPIPHMSILALNMLIERINGSAPADARTVIVDPQLVVRQSTAGG